jgi:hypothetical protein
MSTVLLRAAVLGGFPRTGPTAFDRVRPSSCAEALACRGYPALLKGAHVAGGSCVVSPAGW